MPVPEGSLQPGAGLSPCQPVQRVPQTVLKAGGGYAGPEALPLPNSGAQLVWGVVSHLQGLRVLARSAVVGLHRHLPLEAHLQPHVGEQQGQGGDNGFRGTVTPDGWNQVWTVVVGRAELGAGQGSRAMLLLRTFPSPFCALGNVLEESRRGREAAEGARPRPAVLYPGFRVHSRHGGSRLSREKEVPSPPFSVREGR